MAARRGSANRRERRGGKQVADGDPTTSLLNQTRTEYEAFEEHRYADNPWTDAFGRQTAKASLRGNPSVSGQAFNPFEV